jgi:hypothetical protein
MKGVTMAVYDEDFDENYEREGVLIVWGDCSCDVNYICRSCLAKW